MAKQILTGLDVLALPSLTTPKTGSVGFGAKADGLYQKIGEVESKLSTIEELLGRVKTPVPSGAKFTDTNTTYTAGSGLTLSGTQFSLPVTVSGTGTFVKSITQGTNGVSVTLGTPPNTDTKYSTGTLAQLNAGADTTGRLHTAKLLNDWLTPKLDLKANLASPTFTGIVTAPTFTGALSGNASTATTLATAININGTSFDGSATITTANWGTSRTLSFTGDVTGSSSVNGSKNVATAMTLKNSGVTAGTYRSVTVDVKGRVTAGTNPTTLAGYGITDAVTTNTTQSITGTKTFTKRIGANLGIKIGTHSTDGLIEWDATNNAFKFNGSLYATGGVSSLGLGEGGGSGGGDVDMLDTWENYTEAKADYYAPASLLVSFRSDTLGRLGSLESGSATSITTTGTGNAITGISKSGSVITATKGSTFALSSHNHNTLYKAIGYVPTWGEVTGKPSTFTPSTHTHTIANVTGLQTALDSKQATLTAGSNITITGSTIAAVNTTYSAATTSANGLMSSADKTKLNGIATGANKYSLPTASDTVLGGVKVGSNLSISSGVLSATNTTYSAATTAANGLMSAADKVKLNGIATEANKYTHPTSAGNKHIPTGGATGQFLKWSSSGTAVWAADNNTTYVAATTSANGLMTAADKVKLNGIATGANQYSLPTASSTTLGGIKVGSRLSISSGTLSATVQSDNNFTTALKNKLDGIATGATNLSLGTSSTTAYRGDRGTTAYNHSQATGNPHGTTFAQISSKPTSLSGFGITNAYTKVEVDELAKYIGSYNFSNGFLVKTDVARNENSMLVLHIKGNSYAGAVPINTLVQVYNYVSTDSLIQTGALNNGYAISEVKVFYYNNLVYFWVPQQTSFMTMTFQLLKAEGQVNRVSSVSNSAVPTTGVEKMVTITPRTAWFRNTLTNLSQLTDNIGVATHIANKANPHAVTKAQVGLGSVTNQSKATMFTNPTFTGIATSPTFKGALDGNAATASKLGTATVGSTQLPIYLNAGTATAITRANLRIGLFGATAIGSTTRPIYIAANGVPTAITGSIANSTTGSAATLTTPRNINGTSFNGSAAITTANWGTSRTLTVGNKGKSVNGSGGVSWSLSEIGALPIAGGTMTGVLKAQNNTSYTTKQVRNMILSTADASTSSMANGDIWIKYV